MATFRLRPLRWRFRPIFVWLYFFLTGFALFLFLSGVLLFSTTRSGLAAESSIPTVDFNGAKVPDWNQITFGKLPGLASSGSFQAPNNAVSELGYDPSRSWSSGQSLTEVSALGDFQDSFQLQNFDMNQISQITGLDLENTSLADFGLMVFQNLQSLVEAIPSLKDFPIEQVLPVNDLLTQSVGNLDSSQTIGQLLQQSPHLGDLSFADLPLEGYKLTDIPNLEATPLGNFKDWQGVTLDKIPGLNDVPFNEFPSPPVGGGMTGIVDVAFGAAESQRQRTISGSDVEGFSVPCKEGCAHIELSGNSQVLGKSWISGKYQEVKGGFGVLGAVNNGKEPTGRLPFGDAFKVAIWDVDETKGTVSSVMLFRFCHRGMPDLGCTPYFVPVPFMTYRETQPIFLGQLDGGEASSSYSTPTGVAASEMQAIKKGEFKPSPASARSELVTSPGSNALSSFLPPTLDCNKQYQGVALDAFASALSSIEGDYNSVGAFVCDGSGNCGRGLGAMQYMSYRNDVRDKISSKPGGQEFLASLDKGQAVTGEQILTYFSPADQQELFESDITQLIDVAENQIDPTTGRAFAGDRLIERVAQMHFGGIGAPIDSSATDVHQKLSVKSY
ncbi:MAG: hypothetical protein LDL41_19165, partial [Coleofasciculus sp. S288]|nr:hypothetical protein [Coleofasciculus sp. S288]